MPAFIGAPAKPKAGAGAGRARAPVHGGERAQQHPRRRLQTDTYTGAGPLGRNMQRLSTFQGAECASVTFDRAGPDRGGLRRASSTRGSCCSTRTRSTCWPRSTCRRASPSTGGGNPFTDFSGGGYFYLDNLDRAVIPTTHPPHLGGRARPPARSAPASRSSATTTSAPRCRSATRSSRRCPTGPGGSGSCRRRAWSARSTRPAARCRSLDLGEQIGNSFAVDETGGVFIVSDGALYRFDATAAGAPAVTWRETYAEHRRQEARPDRGRLGHDADADGLAATSRSPTTPTRWTSSSTSARRPVDRQPRWSARSRCSSQGASDTDQSLIGAGRSMVVENNYGYSGLDRDRAGRHDHARASSASTSTTAAPAAARSGTATSARRRWCRSCRSRTGSSTRTRSRRRPTAPTPGTSPRSTSAPGRPSTSGSPAPGLGFNNNYAPVTHRPRRHRLRGRARRPRAALGRLAAKRPEQPPDRRPAVRPQGGQPDREPEEVRLGVVERADARGSRPRPPARRPPRRARTPSRRAPARTRAGRATQHQQRDREEPCAPVRSRRRSSRTGRPAAAARAAAPKPVQARGRPTPTRALEQRDRERRRDSGEPELERHEPAEPPEHRVRIGLDVAVGVDRVERGPERRRRARSSGQAARALRRVVRIVGGLWTRRIAPYWRRDVAGERRGRAGVRSEALDRPRWPTRCFGGAALRGSRARDRSGAAFRIGTVYRGHDGLPHGTAHAVRREFGRASAASSTAIRGRRQLGPCSWPHSRRRRRSSGAARRQRLDGRSTGGPSHVLPATRIGPRPSSAVCRRDIRGASASDARDVRDRPAHLPTLWEQARLVQRSRTVRS